jgi:hypothetical protein
MERKLLRYDYKPARIARYEGDEGLVSLRIFTFIGAAEDWV